MCRMNEDQDLRRSERAAKQTQVGGRSGRAVESGAEGPAGQFLQPCDEPKGLTLGNSVPKEGGTPAGPKKENAPVIGLRRPTVLNDVPAFCKTPSLRSRSRGFHRSARNASYPRR